MPRIGVLYRHTDPYQADAVHALLPQLEWSITECFDLDYCKAEDVAHLDTLILGIPTWECIGIEAQWCECWPVFDELSLKGRNIVLLGLPHPQSSGTQFLHNLDELHPTLNQRGANVISYFELPIIAEKATKHDVTSEVEKPLHFFSFRKMIPRRWLDKWSRQSADTALSG